MHIHLSIRPFFSSHIHPSFHFSSLLSATCVPFYLVSCCASNFPLALYVITTSYVQLILPILLQSHISSASSILINIKVKSFYCQVASTWNLHVVACNIYTHMHLFSRTGTHSKSGISASTLASLCLMITCKFHPNNNIILQTIC